METIQDYSLKEFNSFGLDVRCKSLIILRDESELSTLLPCSPADIFLLGGGSNILLTSHLDKIVIKNEISGIELVEETGSEVVIRVGAGENWHNFVLWCVEQNYGGVENLSLIPGTVGAAPIQNIGAYGVELEEVFVSLEAYEIRTGKKRSFTKEECNYGYRNSVFKNDLKSKYFITRVMLRLSKKDHKLNVSYGAISKFLEAKGIEEPTIEDVSNAVISIRKSKLPDPKELGNSGSFFKNPEVSKSQFEKLQLKFPAIVFYNLPTGMVKVPAGWLIEQCGWKGKKVGNVGCFKNQALVIVNYGGASPREIVRLSKEIQASVFEKFSIQLETEVNFI
jgi:UDP-N-acetylmuramate dehydrogenase